jgi:hypothetical protein
MTSTSRPEDGARPLETRSLPWPWVASLAGGLFVVLKVAAVSKWNPDTGLAVVRSVGIAGVITGLVLAILPGAIPLVGWVTLGWEIRRVSAKGGRPKRGILAIGFSLLVLAALLDPSWIDGLIILGLSVFSLGYLFLSSSARSIRWVVYVMFGAAAFLLLDTALTPRMWLPSEVLEDSEGRLVVGYVTSVESQWTTILTEPNRSILWVKSESVVRRHVCDLHPDDSSPSIMQMWLRTVPNPPCPITRPLPPSTPPSSPSP